MNRLEFLKTFTIIAGSLSIGCTAEDLTTGSLSTGSLNTGSIN